MSITTDEAEKKYPAPTDADDPMYKYVEAIAGYPSAKRQGYIAGRTAEPTEAEIEAALKALRSSLVERNAACRITLTGISEISVGPTIAKLSDGTRLHLDRIVSIVLEAARKAVTE